MALKTNLITYMAALSLLVLSCAGNSMPPSQAGSPLAPQLTQQESSGLAGTHYLWGYYAVFVDPSNLDADGIEIVPVRLATDHWNVLKWLEQTPCTTCVTIPHVENSDHGTRLFDVRITHPFPTANLTGFDVRGIAMFKGSKTFPIAGLTTSERTLGDGELVNADGYTTLYNLATAGKGPGGLQGYIKGKFASVQPPDSALNGYKRYVTNYPTNTRNVFYSGTAMTVTYDIDMPDTAFVFGYAVDASWVPPSNKPVLDPMHDFPPEANCPEPWRIDVFEAPVGDGLTTKGGSTVLTIDVYDRQGKDSHALPVIECPELFDTPVNAEWKSEGIGCASYQVTVTNEDLAPAGVYKCLISVEDNENAGSPEWLDLTAYQIHLLTVSTFQNKLPVANAVAKPNPQLTGLAVHFSDDGSYDPDGGGIVKFEWDWDNDGTFDEEGIELDHTWDTQGTYYVQFRVTDDDDTTDDLDQPLEVKVSDNTGWVVTWETGDWNWSTEVASDGAGNVYVVGMETTTQPLAAVRKVSSTGTIVWTRLLGGDGVSCSDGVDVDDSGNVYFCGFYGETVDFDPGPGEDLHTSNEISDIFLIKLDADGNYIWGRSWGGDLTGDSYWFERGQGVAVDDLGGVYVTGIFRGICDFDPGPGVVEYTSNGYDTAGFDAFLSKFNSSGDFQWARTWGAPNPDINTGETAFGLAVDSAGNPYVTGGFLGTVDFDPGPGVAERTSVGPYGDSCLVKFNPSGDFVWVDAWEGIGCSDFPGYAQCWGGSFVTVDSSDDVYVVGQYEGLSDMDPGPGVDEHDGVGTFLNKFESNGDFIWSRTWSVSTLLNVAGLAVSTDSLNNVYMTGIFAEPVDFDPGPGVDTRTPSTWRNGYLCKLDMGGDYLWTVTWGPASGNDNGSEGWGTCTDEYDFVYVCGYFQGTVDFDPGPGVDSHTDTGTGAFLTRYSPSGTW
jgi:hypothetical protein